MLSRLLREENEDGIVDWLSRYNNFDLFAPMLPASWPSGSWLPASLALSHSFT